MYILRLRQDIGRWPLTLITGGRKRDDFSSQGRKADISFAHYVVNYQTINA